jgi:hypothetical protein
MSKPTFVFVPGAWHGPEIFAGMMGQLSQHGYASTGLTLPSIGANPGLPDFTADVSALQALISTCIDDESLDIILVLWSHGSQVGSESVLPSMLKSARAAEGRKGGVVHLIYVAGVVLSVGQSTEGSREPPPKDAPSIADIDHEAGTFSILQQFAGWFFYNGVEDQELVAKLVARLKPMSRGPLQTPLTRAAWEYTPATWIICEDDPAVPLSGAEKQLKAAKERIPKSLERVERCKTGHAPFLSMPEWTLEVFRRAAGESV